MKKAYLLAFNDTVGTQDQLGKILNKVTEITDWRYDMPHVFYLVSTADAKTLGDKLRELTGKKGVFIITEIPANSWGWLTPESWHMIQKKETKPKDK